MKCEEFQKLIIGEPQEVENGARQHIESCKPCAEFVEEMNLLDDHLHDALQVAVPPALKEELHAKKFYPFSSKTRAFGYALLGSFLFIVGVVLFVNLNGYPLDKIVIAHIEHEPFALTKDMSPSSQEVQNVMDSLNITMTTAPGNVRFIKRCLVGQDFVAHMVVKGQEGPVSMLIMPDHQIKETQSIQDHQLQGYLVPLENQGVAAILAYPGEPLEALKNSIRDTFQIKD